MHAEALALSRNFLTLEDVALLKHIAANLPGVNPYVVDLGAGSGTSAISILEENPIARVFTFDTSVDAIRWTEAAIRNVGYFDRWFFDVKDAADAGNGFYERDVSAVLVDASHLYEETLAALKAWAPHVLPGGWIWCHDYVGDGGIENNGVKQAVDEFLESIAFDTRIDRGLGVAVRVS